MTDAQQPDAAMVIQTANALITGAPISEEQLRAAMPHYAALVRLLSISGPSFSVSMRQAVEMHNKAVRRLKENLEEKRARERQHREAMDGLVELTVE